MKKTAKKINKDIISIKIDTMLLHIDTTGPDYRYSYIYILGYLYYNDGEYYLTQFFSESLFDEKIILLEIINLIDKCEYNIYFYKNDFDFLINKIKFYKINISFNIYKSTIVKNSKKIYYNKEEIDIYFKYLLNKNSKLLGYIFLKNEEYTLNIINKNKLTLNYNFEYKIKLTDNILNIYIKPEEKMSFKHSSYNSWELIPYEDSILIKIEIINDTLLYFFKDYENYFYFPELDEVMHKSIAKYSTLEKQKAKKHNCYIKKNGIFIEIFSDSNDSNEIFMHNINDSNRYILLPENINDFDFKEYINDFLSETPTTLNGRSFY